MDKENFSNHDEDLSARLLSAQQEAESEVEFQALYDTPAAEDAPIVVPKLLELGQGIQKMKEKTNDLKLRGEQLDLLLLKAESYSHFIKQNQELSKQAPVVGKYYHGNPASSILLCNHRLDVFR